MNIAGHPHSDPPHVDTVAEQLGGFSAATPAEDD
jgi:hypothetical protein